MRDDEKRWVSATATRNHVLQNPLLDWLDLFGEANDFIRDADLPDYDERLEFVPFIMQKGNEFETAVAERLAARAPMLTIAQNRDEIGDTSSTQKTFEALAQGQHVVVESAVDFRQLLIFFCLFGVLEKGSHHPHMGEQRVDAVHGFVSRHVFVSQRKIRITNLPMFKTSETREIAWKSQGVRAFEFWICFGFRDWDVEFGVGEL